MICIVCGQNRPKSKDEKNICLKCRYRLKHNIKFDYYAKANEREQHGRKYSVNVESHTKVY